ncbi:hypothetical protein B0H14DRAFT_1658122 [Mycena olivaceomarginata]|nr:hypothetical protein B0H14DRAFT_1658122 [Mycena olivaceomarginata]
MAGQRCRHHLFALPPRPRGRRCAPAHVEAPSAESTARVSAGGAPHTPTARTTSSRGVPPPPTETPPWKQTKTAAHARRYAGSPLCSRRRQVRPSSFKDSPAAGFGSRRRCRHTGRSPRRSCSSPPPPGLSSTPTGGRRRGRSGPRRAGVRAPGAAGVGGSQSQSRSSGRSSGSGSEIRNGWLYSPVGEIAYVGLPARPKKSKSHSKRSTKS